MSSRPIHLAIDARPRGPRGLIAAEVVLGRSMIGHRRVLPTVTETIAIAAAAACAGVVVGKLIA